MGLQLKFLKKWKKKRRNMGWDYLINVCHQIHRVVGEFSFKESFRVLQRAGNGRDTVYSIFKWDMRTPRGCWPLGRIVTVFPGSDNVVRSAEVKTKFGLLRRPVAKLALLEECSPNWCSRTRGKDVTAGNGRDTVYSIFKWDILVTLKWND